MGHRRLLAGGQEGLVARHSEWAPLRVALTRKSRTPAYVVCGFFFLAAFFIVGCRGFAGSPQTSRPPVLTVGVPEGTASSTEVGVAEWAQMLTVEGLTGRVTTD